MNDQEQNGFRTRCVHVGNRKDRETGAVVPPIHTASTFVQPAAGEFGEFDYSRTGNPTRKNLEASIANLENGVGALAFSSGMAATHCAMMLLNAGEHIVAGTDIYGGTYRLLHKVCNRCEIGVTLADTTDPSRLDAAYRPETRMLWIESPGNPLMSITDIEACVEWARAKGILVGMDNTLATPVLTNPLDLGVDIVQHSATKYLGGHSDALGGLLVVRDPAILEQLHFLQNATGAVLSPWDSFLISRGIKTLELRVRQQCENAMQVARFLDKHPRVDRVFYPGLESHPGHAVAIGQMQGGFGGMLSFEVRGGYAAAKAVVDRTELFQLAVSLGAVESLIEHPPSMSHAAYDREDRLKHGINDTLIRLSVGIENIEDLIADLEQALDSAVSSSD